VGVAIQGNSTVMFRAHATERLTCCSWTSGALQLWGGGGETRRINVLGNPTSHGDDRAESKLFVDVGQCGFLVRE